MGRERAEVIHRDTPKGKLMDQFKGAVVLTEAYLSEDEVGMDSWQLFEKRKHEMSVIKGTKELSDSEFVDEWMVNADIPSHKAFEIGMVLGEMIADERNNPFSKVPRHHADEVGSRQFALQEQDR